MSRVVPHFGSQFVVEIDGIKDGKFTSVGGLSMEVEVVEYQEASVAPYAQKVPGANKTPDITLSRPMRKDKDFRTWLKNIQDGKDDVRSAAVTWFSADGTEIGRWSLFDVWPKSYAIGDLDAGAGDAITEDITLACERIKREK